MRSNKLKGKKTQQETNPSLTLPKIQNSESELLSFGTTCLFCLAHRKTNSKSPERLSKHLQLMSVSSIQPITTYLLSLLNWSTSTYHKRLLYCSMPLLFFDCSSTVRTHPQGKMQHIVCFWRCGKCCFARIFYSAL